MELETYQQVLIYGFFGAIMMGIGGVLAMGSFLALGSIIFGSALTMKIQYYKLMYDEEANFIFASISSLVEMHLLPTGMRKPDPP